VNRLDRWTGRRDHDRSGIVGRALAFAEDRPAFTEGLALGAVVGAAIAGSTLWSRLRASRRRAAADVAVSDPGGAP